MLKRGKSGRSNSTASMGSASIIGGTSKDGGFGGAGSGGSERKPQSVKLVLVGTLRARHACTRTLTTAADGVAVRCAWQAEKMRRPKQCRQVEHSRALRQQPVQGTRQHYRRYGRSQFGFQPVWLGELCSRLCPFYRRFVWPPPTAAFMRKELQVSPNFSVRFDIWDTAGEEHIRLE